MLKSDDGLLSKADLMEAAWSSTMYMDKIWELSDQDEDGFLDRYEFSIFAHLTEGAYCFGYKIPDQVVITPQSPWSILILYITAST